MTFNCFSDVHCATECTQEGEALQNMVREACCEGLEECTPRFAKSFTGWLLLIVGAVLLIPASSCLYCCRMDVAGRTALVAAPVQELQLQQSVTRAITERSSAGRTSNVVALPPTAHVAAVV
jgi:hypothetical protein